MSTERFLDRLATGLAKTGLQDDSLGVAVRLMWRAFLLGTALYLMLDSEPDSNLKLNGVSYIAAFLWAYYDGLIARRIWSIACLEAIFLHLAGVQVGNLLTLTLGNPVLGT